MREHQELLKNYAQHGDEGAFRELVSRYGDLVYSVALRRLNGDAHLAQDAVQMVFTDLAKKAPQLISVPMLGGWLHRHICFVSSTLHRSEQRRIAREQLSLSMNEPQQEAHKNDSELKSVLDEAIDQLESNDREAVILRFFEKQPLRKVGTTLGITEDAAQKRVKRALEKLRGLLSERGIALSTAGLASILESQAITRMPASLADHICRQVLEITLKSTTATLSSNLFKKPALKIGLATVALFTTTTLLVTRNKITNLSK